jgi:hypothetical protein
MTWTPFTDTTFGSHSFTFAFQSYQFWSHANTSSQQSSMGLITAPNDWASNGYQFAQITYTRTFPGNWLAVSVGQYSFGQYDGNQYAGNAQTNFVNYALVQNATQTYANAGIGAHIQIMANPRLQLAGGLQSATDISGETLTRGIVNKPFGRNRLDQSGIGMSWNKTNDVTVEGRLRSSERRI